MFEEIYSRPAKLKWRTWAPVLRRIFARFDRFTGGVYEPGRAGIEEARHLLQALAVDGIHGPAVDPGSAAYFVPILDEVSKQRRRYWKATKTTR